MPTVISLKFPNLIFAMVIAGFAALAILSAAPALAQTVAAQCAKNAEAGDVVTCQEALAERPGDLELRRLLAHALTIAGNFPAAVLMHRGIVKERPDDPRAHFDLASLLGAIRRYEEAIEPIEAAIRLQPDNLFAYLTAAVVYAQTGRMKDAVAITSRAAALGDTASMYEMSLYLQDGIGVPADQEKAFYWTKRAAERNHVAAMQLMSAAYLEGLLGQRRDQTKAFEWAQRAREEMLRSGK